ncbi:hypothetical protein ACFCXG_38100, partial [Streptomyces sp. NPDC056295]
MQLRALADEVPVGCPVRRTVACQGGGHRSVAAAETVGRLVWEAWGGAYGVDIEHHHVDHPVLTASTPPDPPGRGDRLSRLLGPYAGAGAVLAFDATRRAAALLDPAELLPVDFGGCVDKGVDVGGAVERDLDRSG